MDVEKARFVPRGSGGYFCTIEIERVENGCVIRLINTNLEDFAFLMGYEKWLPFKIDGVLVCQGENPKTVKFMKGGAALNYIDAVKFMETRTRFKKI